MEAGGGVERRKERGSNKYVFACFQPPTTPHPPPLPPTTALNFSSFPRPAPQILTTAIMIDKDNLNKKMYISFCR